MTRGQAVKAWGKILSGKVPMLSIEITRECPLHCPGCYAYGEDHLGGGVTLRELSDLRGDALVEGVLALVRKHEPLQVSLVGGEPLVRHRELSHILPELGRMGIYTLVVTSAVLPIPVEWNNLPGVRIAVSIDGLREDHDKRRQPATYSKILDNIAGRRVDVSWVVTGAMMGRPGYLEEYLDFWTPRPEVDRIWLNIYTPQAGERSEEALSREHRNQLIAALPVLKSRFPQLLMTPGIAEAFGTPPSRPEQCTFANMSLNYSADLKTRIEPCFYGGQPDCSQCGCAVTAGLHWVGQMPLMGPLLVRHVLDGSIAFGAMVGRMRQDGGENRWKPVHRLRRPDTPNGNGLVQIH